MQKGKLRPSPPPSYERIGLVSLQRALLQASSYMTKPPLVPIINLLGIKV